MNPKLQQQVTIDPEADAIYIEVADRSKGGSYTQEIVRDCVYVDFDSSGRLLGVEVLLPGKGRGEADTKETT